MKPIEIEYWRLSQLTPYAGNPRRNDHAVEQMVASLREFEFKIPLLVRSDGELIDGHLRLKAAQKLGLEQVPVIVCDDWTEAQVKAFRLLVNRSATWAEWDAELLSVELEELQSLHFDLELTGFDAREIDVALHGNIGEDGTADQVPAVPTEPVSRTGDLWCCGAHRVLCGDATNRDHVARVLAQTAPALMITDPPYGVEYDPEWRERAGLGRLRQTGKVSQDDRCDWTAAYQLFPGAVVYVWHAGIHAAEVAEGLSQAQFQIRSQIIWAKQHFVLSRGHYHWQHEPCWYAVRQGCKAEWCGDRSQSTLWEVSNLNPFGAAESGEEKTGHGTQKPVELMRRPILNHTREGAVVYDPFLGSGTMLIAAELTGRVCYGLEIEPRYVDVIVRRWEQVTGKLAVLERDGRTFAEIAQQRENAELPVAA